MIKGSALIPAERIEHAILLIRGKKVMLDVDLARLYGVPTKRFNEQVRRNRERFPEDFMFQLTEEDMRSLRSQIATSNKGRGGRRYLPYAFTEQGVAMLSSVLRSERAVQVNIQIMGGLCYDVQFRVVFDAIRELMTPGEANRRAIGFHADRR